MFRNFRIRTYFFALASMAVAACGGGGDTTSGPVVGVATTVGFSSTSFTFVAIGASQVVTVTVTDAAGRAVTSAPVTWVSDDPSVADVSASGNTATIVAKKSGNTNIRASTGSLSSAIAITVYGVKSLTVNPAISAIRAGDVQTFVADVVGEAGVSRSVNWSTSNSAVATIAATGVLTAIAPGSVTVSATAVADTGKVASAALTVLPSKGVAITPATVSIATGVTQQLVASVVLDPGSAQTVTWASSAPSVATVNASGVVTGVALGSATITATSTFDPTFKGSTTINVIPVVRTLVVAAPSGTPFYLGATQTLVATITADAGVVTTLAWSSSNPSVATVSTAGVVTANAVGTATITATSTADITKTASVAVTTISRPISITATPAVLAITAGNTATIVATVNADPIVSKAVTWSTSAASIATVSNGVVTGVANGAAIVTATSVADPTKTAAISVSVGPRLASSWSATGLGGVMIENIVSTYAVNGNNVFSVNARGDVFRFDGATWSKTATGGSFNTTFTSVHGTSATNVIAVGTGGKIVQWNGTTWTAMTSPTSQDLNDVWMESPTSAFAVGVNGVAVQLTGTTWATSATNSSERLNAVWFAGSNTWFAVGTNGELLRWLSGTWTRLQSNTQFTLNDVFGIAPNDVYAVGQTGLVMHWDGATWTTLDANGVYSDLYSITGTSTGGSKIFIGGDRIVVQIIGGVVTPSSIDAPYLVGFFSASADANGAIWLGGERGAELRNTNGNWATMNIAPDLIDVWATSTTNAWAVGELGFIYRFNGTTWTRQTSPTSTTLNAVWGSGSSDAFAGGNNGIILHWDGTAWTPMTSPTAGDVVGLWGTSSQNVYATTSYGEVLRYNGSGWSIATAQANPLYAVYGSSASDVYAVGDLGTLLKYDGTTWTASTTGNSTLLTGVWASAPNNVFTVGVNGITGVGYRYGTAWQTLNVGSTVELTSIWGPSPSDIYVSGALGTILRFDGNSWQTMPTGSSEYLWSLTGDPSGLGAGFAVGFNSTLVTGAGSASLSGLRAAAALRGVGNLEPSSAAMAARHNVRALPRGAARRAVKGSRALKR
jgi:uncharacterized protein YjdB